MLLQDPVVVDLVELVQAREGLEALLLLIVEVLLEHQEVYTYSILNIHSDALITSVDHCMSFQQVVVLGVSLGKGKAVVVGSQGLVGTREEQEESHRNSSHR